MRLDLLLCAFAVQSQLFGSVSAFCQRMCATGSATWMVGWVTTRASSCSLAIVWQCFCVLSQYVRCWFCHMDGWLHDNKGELLRRVLRS